MLSLNSDFKETTFGKREQLSLDVCCFWHLMTFSSEHSDAKISQTFFKCQQKKSSFAWKDSIHCGSTIYMMLSIYCNLFRIWILKQLNTKFSDVERILWMLRLLFWEFITSSKVDKRPPPWKNFSNGELGLRRSLLLWQYLEANYFPQQLSHYQLREPGLLWRPLELSAWLHCSSGRSDLILTKLTEEG